MSTIVVNGRIGGDVITKQVGDSTVAEFSLAESHYAKGKGKDGGNYITEWHKVSAWGPLSTLASKNLGRGRQVTVVGERKMDAYEKDGEVKEIFRIRASEIHFDRSVQSEAPAQAEEEEVNLEELFLEN